MDKEFVTYEIALKLKELGFNEPCICGFNSYKVLKSNITGTNADLNDYTEINKYDQKVLAPLWQQVIPFLNEKLVKLGYENYSDAYITTDFHDLRLLELDILNAIEIINKN